MKNYMLFFKNKHFPMFLISNFNRRKIKFKHLVFIGMLALGSISATATIGLVCVAGDDPFDIIPGPWQQTCEHYGPYEHRLHSRCHENGDMSSWCKEGSEAGYTRYSFLTKDELEKCTSVKNEGGFLECN